MAKLPEREQCQTACELVAYLRGWWGYFHLAAQRQPLLDLEGWLRRHIRACFWQRWHNVAGRFRALRRLGLRPRACEVARSSQGAWPLAACWSLHHALSNAVLRSHGFLMPSDLAALTRC